ncbi:MAG: Rhodanese-related sulfurtransferase [Pedosphaera sp.]|nr:Rhodanese-related sulfurtransferase [Pedosphaera sp.]
MPQPQSQILKQLPFPMVAMLAGSLLLGVAYNSASPLGVRAAKAQESATAVPSATSPSRTGYGNETISLTMESARNPRVPGSPYGNQVVAVGLEPVQPVQPMQTAPAQLTFKNTFPSLVWPEVQLLQKSGEIMLVDARMTTYFQAEHIPGAVSLPANSSETELTAFAAKYPKATPLIVYCGSSTCPMAHNLADLLASQYGYVNIKLMPGGFAEYRIAQAQAGTGGGK